MDAQLNTEDGRFVSAAYKKINKSPAADDSFGYSMRAQGTWKNNFHPRSAGRPNTVGSLTHRGPVPHNAAQQG